MDDTKLTLAFTGDICLASLAAERHPNMEFPEWPSIRKAIGDHNRLIGNLECCLVDNKAYCPSRPQKMAVPASAAQLLSDMGVTELNLANNHILDCGPESIDIAREQLTTEGIRCFGAGASLHEAEQVAYAQEGPYKIAFLGACDYGNYYADKLHPGVAPMVRKRLGRRVRHAAQRADLVVVTLHADLEFCPVPGMWRQRLSRWLIDQGAHLIIQHHPHVLQGVEHYRHGLIAYSLGNFIFRVYGNAYQQGKKGVADSMILVVEADMHGATPKLSSRIVPLRIGRDHLPHLLDQQSHTAAQQRFKQLSNLVNEPRAHRLAWFRRCRREATQRMYRVYYAIARRQFRRTGSEINRLLTRQEDRRWLIGLLSFGFL